MSESIKPINQSLIKRSSTTSASFYIELRRPLSAGTANDKHHLHISEIEAYDNDDTKCTLKFSGKASPLVKLGAKWKGKQLDPALALDGDYSTVTHNDWSKGSDYGTEDHFMEFETTCNSISKIRIYNRPDGARVRIKGSVLYLMNRNGDVITSHTISNVGTATGGQYIIDWTPDYKGYTIEFRRPLTYTGGDKHHLHIREIEALDLDNNPCQLSFRGANGDASALMNPGKYWVNKFLTPELCIDKNQGTMNHNDYGSGIAYASEEHFMRFECFCEKSIGTIKIYNRNDGSKMAERLSSSDVTLMRRSDGAVIDSHTIGKDETDAACCGGDKSIDWCPNLDPPTLSPTTLSPTTSAPTTSAPTTSAPTTAAPTLFPTTLAPTLFPTTLAPTPFPTKAPTQSPTPSPTPPELVVKPNHSCGGVALDVHKNLGVFESAEECALVVQANTECDQNVFMWSDNYPSWGCRCCKSRGSHPQHNNWDLYSIAAPELTAYYTDDNDQLNWERCSNNNFDGCVEDIVVSKNVCDSEHASIFDVSPTGSVTTWQCTEKPTLQPELTAYWNSGNCGPFEDVANWPSLN